MAIKRFTYDEEGLFVYYGYGSHDLKKGDYSIVQEAELAALEARWENLEQAMLEAAKLWAVWEESKKLTPSLIERLDSLGKFIAPLYTVKKD